MSHRSYNIKFVRKFKILHLQRELKYIDCLKPKQNPKEKHCNLQNPLEKHYNQKEYPCLILQNISQIIHMLFKISERQLKGYAKTVKQGQSGGFMCLLFYLTVKFFTILILINWSNSLKNSQNLFYVLLFVFLLIINTYLMLTTGNNPGFYITKITQQQENILLDIFQLQQSIKNQELQISSDQKASMLQSELAKQSTNKNLISSVSACSNISKQKSSTTTVISLENYCRICNCLQRPRMKHCYHCGHCIMKFDHHCPWIGSCVGEQNHFKFVCCLFAHTLQSLMTFVIFIKSIGLYEYYNLQSDTFSREYAIFAIWTGFMFLYLCFAGGLFFFHLYLVVVNLTTRELMSRRKCNYLRNVNGNPFDQGCIKNIKYAISPNPQGKY